MTVNDITSEMVSTLRGFLRAELEDSGLSGVDLWAELDHYEYLWEQQDYNELCRTYARWC